MSLPAMQKCLGLRNCQRLLSISESSLAHWMDGPLAVLKLETGTDFTWLKGSGEASFLLPSMGRGSEARRGRARAFEAVGTWIRVYFDCGWLISPNSPAGPPV